MAPDVLVGLLAEPDRMKVFAAVVLGASSPIEIGERTALTPRQVAGAVRRLREGGLLVDGASGLVARLEVFKQSMKEHGRRRAGSDDGAVGTDDTVTDRTVQSVLRAFLVDGRLVAIPVAQAKRRIILEHVVTVFEPGVRYPEREVDALLRAWHPDQAALRRFLVDEGLLTRDHGVYWRIGGPYLPN
jgi:hypothetical protein